MTLFFIVVSSGLDQQVLPPRLTRLALADPDRRVRNLVLSRLQVRSLKDLQVRHAQSKRDLMHVASRGWGERQSPVKAREPQATYQARDSD